MICHQVPESRFPLATEKNNKKTPVGVLSQLWQIIAKEGPGSRAQEQKIKHLIYFQSKRKLKKTPRKVSRFVDTPKLMVKNVQNSVKGKSEQKPLGRFFSTARFSF